MGNHRLWGMRCYLSGAMDCAIDNGIGWREYIDKFLQNLGIVVINPCNKRIFYKDGESKRSLLIRLRKDNLYYEMNNEVKEIRYVDLRLVSISDFIIVYLNNNISSCGTWEEIGKANDQRKPILIVCEQGKNSIPGWVFGMIPHQHMFEDWEELKRYLLSIHLNDDKQINDMGRWIFFDHSKFFPKVSVEESEKEIVL